MSDTTAIRQALRTFVQENFLYMRPDLSFADDDSLLANGVIDSLGVMEIVGFIEERWSLAIEPDDVTEQNFGSLGAIANYVSARGGASSAAG
jgi:acyl carrier protein